MEYENKELVDSIDLVASEILAVKRSMHHRDKFFPALINKLDLKVGVEVGVDKGEFSTHLLGSSSLKTLFCVDTWQNEFGSNYKPGFYDPQGDNRYQDAINTLKEFGERVVPMRGTSVDMANSISAKFPNQKIDFCYIDGDHTYEGVYVDIRAWLPKMRIGGIIAGHDYHTHPDGPKSGIMGWDGKQLPFGVNTVVDGYCQRYGYPLRVVGGRILSWFFVKNKEVQDPLGIYSLRG